MRAPACARPVVPYYGRHRTPGAGRPYSDARERPLSGGLASSPTLSANAMPDKFTRETKLAGFLVLAAISPIVSWYMLLFVAKPSNVSVAAAAWSELSYVFSSESAELWWFVLWAMLPVLLLATAIACYTRQPLTAATLRILVAIGLVFAVASAYLWPVEVLPIAGAIYFAYPRRTLPNRDAVQ
jgi:hypothetical protein